MARWQEHLHPRDWRGRFITKGALVRLQGGLIGTVREIRPGRQEGAPASIRVEVADGRSSWVPSDRITVAEPPRGGTFLGDGTVARVGDEVRHTDEPGSDVVKKVSPDGGAITVGRRGDPTSDREVDPATLSGGSRESVPGAGAAPSPAPAARSKPFAQYIEGPPNERFTPREIDAAVEDYKEAAYWDVNNALRGKPLRSFGNPQRTIDNPYFADMVSKQIRKLDQAMTPLARDRTVYRRTETDLMAGLNPGDVFEDPAYMSTTPTRGGADRSRFGEYLLEISVPAGTPQFYRQERGENEMLLGRGQKLEIISKRGNVVKARVIPASEAARTEPDAVDTTPDSAPQPPPSPSSDVPAAQPANPTSSTSFAPAYAPGFSPTMLTGLPEADQRAHARLVTQERNAAYDVQRARIAAQETRAGLRERSALVRAVAEGSAARSERQAMERRIIAQNSASDAELPEEEDETPPGVPSAPAPAAPAAPTAPAASGPLAADGRPLVVGDRITVNGRNGTVTSVRTGTGIAIYEDSEGRRGRSARIDRINHADDAPKATAPDVAELAPAPVAPTPGTLTDKEVASVRNYVLYGSDSINGYLRGDVGVSATTIAQAAAMQDLIKRSTVKEPVVAYRSVGVGRGGDRVNNVERAQVGDTIAMPGFSSTNVGTPSGDRYALMPYQLELDIPAGTNGVRFREYGLGDPAEDELLLPHNARITVTERTEANGITRIRAAVSNPLPGTDGPYQQPAVVVNATELVRLARESRAAADASDDPAVLRNAADANTRAADAMIEAGESEDFHMVRAHREHARTYLAKIDQTAPSTAPTPNELPAQVRAAFPEHESVSNAETTREGDILGRINPGTGDVQYLQVTAMPGGTNRSSVFVRVVGSGNNVQFDQSRLSEFPVVARRTGVTDQTPRVQDLLNMTQNAPRNEALDRMSADELRDTARNADRVVSRMRISGRLGDRGRVTRGERLVAEMNRRIENLARESGDVETPEFTDRNVLEYIANENYGTDELARVFGIPQPQMLRALRRLESAGYIARNSGEDGGTSVSGDRSRVTNLGWESVAGRDGDHSEIMARYDADNTSGTPAPVADAVPVPAPAPLLTPGAVQSRYASDTPQWMQDAVALDPAKMRNSMRMQGGAEYRVGEYYGDTRLVAIMRDNLMVGGGRVVYQNRLTNKYETVNALGYAQAVGRQRMPGGTAVRANPVARSIDVIRALGAAGIRQATSSPSSVRGFPSTTPGYRVTRNDDGTIDVQYDAGVGVTARQVNVPSQMVTVADALERAGFDIGDQRETGSISSGRVTVLGRRYAAAPASPSTAAPPAPTPDVPAAPAASSVDAPLAPGQRITVNGRTGTIMSIRTGTGIVMYEPDGDPGRRRSARIDRVTRADQAAAPAAPAAPAAAPAAAPSAPAASRITTRPAPRPPVPMPAPAAPDAPVQVRRDASEFASWGDRAEAIASSPGPALANAPGSLQRAVDRRSAQNRFRKAAEDVYNQNGGLGKNGATVKFFALITNGTNKITLNGQVYDKNGGIIGTIVRSINYKDGEPVEVHNDYLQLNSDQQGQGIASDLYRRQEDWFIREGVPIVTILANIDVGGFAWARKGFDYDGPEEAARHLRSIARRARSLNLPEDDIKYFERAARAARNALGDRFAPKTWPTPYEVSQYGYKPGDTMWPGKDLMLGTHWNAIKHLDPPAAPAGGTREQDSVPTPGPEQRPNFTELPKPLTDMTDDELEARRQAILDEGVAQPDRMVALMMPLRDTVDEQKRRADAET